MNKLYLISIIMIFGLTNLAAQDPTPGTFLGQAERVECGTTVSTTAKVTYKFFAKSYYDARITAERLRWRFENLYANSPSYLREYYVCKSKECGVEPACWAYAEIIDVDAIRLTEFENNTYVLLMYVNYKVQCLDCNG